MHAWGGSLRAFAGATALAALAAGPGVVTASPAAASPAAASAAAAVPAAVAAPAVAAPAVAPPAVAADWSVLVAPATWAYTDSRTPNRSTVDPAGDVPVGAWRDDRDRKHRSKAYFTFDLTALRGARIIAAEAIAGETAATDCAKPRATELWITDTATRPTWRDQPTERTRLSGPGALPGCTQSYLDWNALPAVQQALASNSGTVTLALRMTAGRQDDVPYGRRYESDLSISVRYNFPPLTPTELAVDQLPCAEPVLYSGLRPELSARLTDFNGVGGGLDHVTGRFAIWPVDRPVERTEYTTAQQSSGSVARVSLPSGLLTDATEYAWVVRAADDLDVSPWSEPCRFVTDAVRPSAPGVSSAVYPEQPHPGGGGPGVPGEFVLSAAEPDVVGFHYYSVETGFGYLPVGADGTATFTYTPEDSGPHQVEAYAVDRAGNRSDDRRYRFWVRDPAPLVDCLPYDAPLGEPRQCTFFPGMDDVVSYTYSFDGGPDITVPAGADGTATVSVTPPSGLSELVVTSTTATGEVSPPGHQYLQLWTEPTVECQGHPGPLECTLTPVGMSGVTEYTYRLDDGPELTVAADAEGMARIEVAVDTPGSHDLVVVAHTGTGLRSDPATYSFYVGTEPVVTSAVYPEGELGGGVGVPGEFVVTPGRMPGVTEYVYSVDFGEEIMVPADADGGVTIPFTPDRAGWYSLLVAGRTADGTTSDQRYYSFQVAG